MAEKDSGNVQATPLAAAPNAPMIDAGAKLDAIPWVPPELSPIPSPLPAPPHESPAKDPLRKSPEWKVLEPEDTPDPVIHEQCEMQRFQIGWKVLAASVRGKLHAHTAKWRDDAYALGAIDAWTVLVMSDGAGGSPLSRVGARIACDEAVKIMKDMLEGFRLEPGTNDTPGLADLVRMRTFLSEGARRAQVGIFREAQKRKVQRRDLNATFLMVVHCPWGERDFVAGIQIGDGAVGAFLDDESCTLLGIADHGEYSAETRFLTTPGIEFEFDQRVLFCCKKGLRCLAVMCDGVSDDFFPEDKRLIELFVGNPIRELKTRAGEPVQGVMRSLVTSPEDGKALVDWLRYEMKQSSDDRTLLLMVRGN